MSETSKEMNINELPVELLIAIFEYLKEDDMREAVEVCSKWKDIIGTTPSTMKQLPLYVYDLLEYNNSLYDQTFFKITLDTAHLSEFHFKFVEHHASHARHLVVRSLQNKLATDGEPEIIKLLRYMPLLEKITFDEVATHELNVESLKSNCIVLEKLRKVILSSCDPSILHAFDTSRVSSLKQNFNEGTSREIIPKDMPLLTELVIRQKYASFNASQIQLTSPLKKFSSTIADESLLLDLLKTCSTTLEELELGQKYSSETYEFVYKNLSQLKFLKINMKALSMENEDDRKLVETLRQNTNVKTLILHSSSDFEFAQVFISKLPNIESLVLNFDMNAGNPNLLMTFIALTLRKLRVLEIQQLGNSICMSVIPSLRELKIHRSISLSTPEWRSMTEGCPNIEHLSVENIYNAFLFSASVVEIICQNLRNLKTLFIGEGFIATKEIFDLLRTCPNLKKVALLKNAIDEPAIAEEFTKSGPQLLLLDALPSNIRTDFNTWVGEDVNLISFEDEEHQDFDAFFLDGEDYLDDDRDDDEFPNEVDDFVLYEGGDYEDYEGEGYSDDEYGGPFRPG